MLFLASRKLFLASRRGYFPDVKQIDSICFQIFRTIIPLFLLINSLREAYREEAAEENRREERRLRIERRSEIYSLTSKNSENYFSNQGANTLRFSSLSRNLRKKARRNSQAEAAREVTRGLYRPSVLRFPEPGEKGIPSGGSPIVRSLASSKG